MCKMEWMKKIIIFWIGSIIAAYGITLAMYAGFGGATLAVLWQGISKTFHISIGMASMIVAVVMIIFVFFYDRSQLHIGTVLYQIVYSLCNGIFNHTSLCEFYQSKLLFHLTIPFEEKPKTNLPGDNLRYYRQRKQMTTRHIAEKLDIVPATVTMYENGKQPIPYDVAAKLADILEIEASLLYDDFSRFLAVPYTEALKSVRTALGLSQKAFAKQIEIAPGYYYKLEGGNRRPLRKIYQKICAMLEATGLQTSLLWEHPLQ